MAFLQLRFVILLLFYAGLAQAADYHHSAIVGLNSPEDSSAFRTGLDLMVEYKYMSLSGRNLAVIANQGSKSLANRLIFDIFQADIPKICQVFIMVDDNPETTDDPGFIYYNSDSNTSVRFYNLNSGRYQLNEEMFQNVDEIVVDLPNSGLRESLAIGVLIEALKFSAENQIPVMVLDRPNPLMGVETGGPVSDKSKFAGGLSLPARYGLTFGELALMMNEENWLNTEKRAPLTIIKMANYNRDMRWKTTGLKWYHPDKIIRDEETAMLQAGLFYLQYTNISLGHGTIQPYQFIGAPWISGKELVQALAGYHLGGVDVYPVDFTPRSENTLPSRPLYADVECSGISVRIRDLAKFDAYRFGIILTSVISRLHPQRFQWINPEAADHYSGGEDFRIWVDIGADLKPMLADWIAASTAYQKTRLGYLLYSSKKK